MARLNIKKITAVACAAAVCASLSACGANATWGATYDDIQIPAGIYISLLSDAAYNASNQIKEQNPDLPEGTSIYTLTLDGKDVKTWIKDEATESMRSYAAVEKKFTEMGLTLSADDKDAVKLRSDQIWDYIGETYEAMGISQNSYTAILLNDTKKEHIFNALYGEGGEKYVTDDEVWSFLDTEFAMVDYIEMEMKDGEGNLLKSDGRADRMKMAEEYIERYKNGEDFDMLNTEYLSFYNQLVADAQAAAEVLDGTDADSMTVDVDSSDAQDEAPAEEPENNEVSTEDAAAETETAVTEASADETDTDAEETAAAEESADEDASSDIQVKVDENGETILVDTDGNPIDMNDYLANNITTVSSNKRVIRNGDATISADFDKAVFEEMEKGEIKSVLSSDEETLYVILKMDILENQDYFDNSRENLVQTMKSDEFEDYMKQLAAEINLIPNDVAYNKYDPEKLFGSF